MKIVKYFYLLLLCSFMHSVCVAQNARVIDSMELLLKVTPQNSVFVDLCNQIALEYWESKPDLTISYSQKAIALSEKLNYKKGKGDAYHKMSLAYFQLGDPKLRMEWMQKCLELRIEIGDKMDIARAYRSIGNLYRGNGLYPQAMQYLLKALKTFEEFGNKDEIGSCYRSIGDIYSAQGNNEEALVKYKLYEKLIKETNNRRELSAVYGGLGSLYSALGDDEKALECFLKVVALEIEFGQKSGMAYTYMAISKIYIRQQKYEEAKKLNFEALNLFRLVKEPGGEIMPNILLGSINTKQGNYAQAFGYLENARKLAESAHSKYDLYECYMAYTHLDSATGKFTDAFKHYKLSIAYRDSVSNLRNIKAITEQQMQFDFEKLQVADSIRFQQERKIGALQLGRQKTYTYVGFAGVLLVGTFLFFVFRQRNFLSIEKKRSDDLLLNILPSDVANELKLNGRADAKQFESVTVMFTDFKDFTKISGQLTPAELVGEIDYYFKEFDRIIARNNLEKIKTIGDSYMCAGGLPTTNETHPYDVVSAAIQMLAFIQEYSHIQMAKGKTPFEIRIGIHTGPVVAGIVGLKKFAYDIWGDTVNTASRMESHGEAGKINISETTYKYVMDKFYCIPRGKIQAKGKGDLEMYFVDNTL